MTRNQVDYVTCVIGALSLTTSKETPDVEHILESSKYRCVVEFDGRDVCQSISIASFYCIV